MFTATLRDISDSVLLAAYRDEICRPGWQWSPGSASDLDAMRDELTARGIVFYA